MTADTVGGVWTYALQLTGALRAYGVEVALATMGRALTEGQREEARELPNLTVCESEYRLEWMDDPWADVRRAGEWLLELEQRFLPDVVHLNSFVHGALSWRAPVLVVGHSCVLSWYEAVRREPPPPSFDRYTREVGRGLRSAQVVAAPTRAMLDELERLYGPLQRCAVIPNGRESGLFQPATKREIVLGVGRLWDEGKNVAALVRVAPRLPWPVYVAGEERHPEGDSVALDNTHHLGRLSPQELARLYGTAAIYAHPARYEPFGLSVLEAALAECALVLGDIPSLREVWDDAALYVPPDDHVALERAIKLLVEQPGLRGEMAGRARRRAIRYTPERMTVGYMGIYRDLLGTGKQESTGADAEPELQALDSESYGQLPWAYQGANTP